MNSDRMGLPSPLKSFTTKREGKREQGMGAILECKLPEAMDRGREHIKIKTKEEGRGQRWSRAGCVTQG